MDDVPAGGAWTVDPETRAALRLERVRASVTAGAWSEGILEAEELLDEAPDHPEALVLLGEALLKSGDFELARQVYEHRVSLDGGPVAGLAGLAESAFHMGDLSVAVESAREAVRRDPGCAHGHYYLGLALERMTGRQAEAMASLAAAAQLDPVEYPLPAALKTKDWPQLYDEALARLAAPLAGLWEGVPVRYEEWPTIEELRGLRPPVSPLIGVLYVGVPPDGEDDPFSTRPEAVRVFTRNLARAGTPEAVVVELAHELQDEALNWLDMELEEI